MNIVVCEDIDGAFQRSGELARLDEGTLRVYDRVAETRAALSERLRDAQVAVAIRDRTVFDRETLNALPNLRLIAVTAGPHRIDIKAASELGIAVAMTPAVSFASIAEYVFGLIIALARGIVPADLALRQRRWEPVPGSELEGKTLGTNMKKLLKSEHPALHEIGESRNWIKVELVSKGWSTDLKYHIIDDLGRELLLRISEGDEFNRRKLDYERILRLSGLGILMSMPVEFGSCCDKKYVYMILTWITGKDAEEELDRLDRTEQYRLGIQAGHTLRIIHSVKGSPDNETWIGRYRKKIERVIELYNRCSTKLRYGSVVIDFIRSNLFRLEGREITLQHGDYHIGSFIITEDNQLEIIDFNRSSYGDPWEEYDRFVFTWRTSIPFAVGQIDGYFNRDVPENFFELMSLYNATNMLASIPWAIPFGDAEVYAMLKNCDLVFECYDGFRSFVPNWYPQHGAQ